MSIETLGATLRQIKRLFVGGVVSGLSDAQLLDRFLEKRDPGAFEALLARHGPMVLSVCRGILRDPAEAEDAFQATFLVMVKKAGTIRGRHALGGWLYQVAHRVALQANKAAARRRTHEREAIQMATAIAASGPTIRDELLPALHEEIARLPEKYRLAVVHCDLEGMTQVQAAGTLDWSERTLRRRLAKARERLKARLTRRSLAPDDAMLGAAFLRESRALVPAAWQEGTVQAALRVLNHAIAVGTVSMAAQSLTREVLKTMFLQKLTLAATALLGAGLMAWATTTAIITRGDEPSKPPSAATPVAQRSAQTPALGVEPNPFDAIGTFPVHGRVIDPGGKPVANAEICILHHTEFGWDPADPAPKGQKGRVAVCDANGRFHFELDKASSDWPYTEEPSWHNAQISAAAPGFGLAWVEAGALVKGDEATLRLVRDDVPIHGRVVDTQGHPVAGVTVRLGQVGGFKDGVDLEAMLASGAVDGAGVLAWYDYDEAIWPGGQNTWTTDGDGRFAIKGVGRDRIAKLVFHSPAVADDTLYVMTRPTRTPPKPRPRPIRVPRSMMLNASFGLPPTPPLVGATFEHVAVPTKPITGVVRLKGTGKPLAGIRVGGAEPSTWTSVSSRTDLQGRFRLLGLPKGELYRIGVGGRSGIDPFLRSEITVSDTEGLKPIETALEVPRGVIVTGRLVDGETGRPVWPASTHYSKLPTNLNEGDGGQGHWTLTDPTLRWTVPPGEGMFCASARGQETPYTRARLAKADKGRGLGGTGDGETIGLPLESYHAYKIINITEDAEPFRFELKLTRGLSRRGSVSGPDGKPVRGAQCFGLIATWGYVKTLPDDTFEVLGLELDHPRQLIFAHKERRLVGSVIIKGEDSPSAAPIEVRLVPPGSVKGRLVDEDGLPRARARLSVLSYALDGVNLPPNTLWPDIGFRVRESFTTDAAGRFQVDGLKPGIKSSIRVEHEKQPSYWFEGGRALSDIVLKNPGEIRDLGDVEVKETQSR